MKVIFDKLSFTLTLDHTLTFTQSNCKIIIFMKRRLFSTSSERAEAKPTRKKSGGAADAQNNGDAERRRSIEVAPRMARRARRGATALRASNEASPRHLGLASALRASSEASPREFGRPARWAGGLRGSARRAVILFSILM